MKRNCPVHVVLLVSASFVASVVGFEDLVILGQQAQHRWWGYDVGLLAELGLPAHTTPLVVPFVSPSAAGV